MELFAEHERLRIITCSWVARGAAWPMACEVAVTPCSGVPVVPGSEIAVPGVELGGRWSSLGLLAPVTRRGSSHGHDGVVSTRAG
jgi:hypothetical protein